MRVAVFALALTFTSVSAHAANLPVKLRDGAAWTQTSVHSRSDTRNGATRATTATSIIKSTYRKEGAVGTLRQDFVSFDVEGVGGEQAKALTEQAKLIYPAVIEVDETLTPTRVRDWDRMRDTIFQAIAAQSPDPRAVDAVKALYEKMDAAQAASLFKEQGLVALGQGSGLNLGEARRYDGETPNTLGGPPIKTSGTFRLESIDKAGGRAVISWDEALEPASLSASLAITLQAMLSRVAPEKQAEGKAQLDGLSFERQQRCRFEVDVATGLAATTDCTVELKSGVQGQLAQRTDHWVITQTLPEAR